MNVDTLYSMVRAAAQGAQRALSSTVGGTSSPDWTAYGSYPVYVAEYNRLLPFVIAEFGTEAEQLFQPIDLGKQINPADTIGLFWKPYLELAYARLAGLTAFLESKTSAPKRQADSIGDLIALNLRAAFYEPPARERDVQNTIETILRARDLDFQREVVAIEFSTKKFVPDFTFETLDLALEVKLCDSNRKEKDIIDEINADIVAYKTRYRRVLFVVFDIGVIRDEHQFKKSIEAVADVNVMVVKW